MPSTTTSPSIIDRTPSPIESKFNSAYAPDDSESPPIIPSPIMLSPTRTPTDCQPLIRKLPRSTSTSRSNLMKHQQQQQHSPKKIPSSSTTVTGSIRARSSSTNSLHGTVQRTNSGGPEKKNRGNIFVK